MADTIKHQGIVENINGTHLQVRIVQTSACAACSIKGHCTSADAKEKLIDVTDEAAAETYRPGDRVWVMGQLSFLFLFLWLFGTTNSVRRWVRCFCSCLTILYCG